MSRVWFSARSGENHTQKKSEYQAAAGKAGAAELEVTAF